MGALSLPARYGCDCNSPGMTLHVEPPEPDEVTSLAGLTAYLKDLSRHFDAERDEWQNWTVGDYLEAIAAWLEATPVLPEAGTKRNEELGGERPTWRGVALLFEVGRLYE